MRRKSCPKRSRKPPRAHFGPPGAPFRPPRGHVGPPEGHAGAHFDPPGALLALPGRSREPLGSLLGPPKTSQNRSRRRSRRPPAPELDFRSILEVLLAPFLDPPDLKKQGFRVDDVAFFENQGVRKTPKTPPKKAWLSRNGKRVRSESRKHRKRRKTRGEKPKQRREEPEQNKHPDWSWNVSFLVRLFRSCLARSRGRLRKHASRSASL